MSILRSKKKVLITAAICLLLAAAILLAVVWLTPPKNGYDDENYKAFTMGDADTGFLRIYAPRELELKKGSSGVGRTIIFGPVTGPKNIYVTVEQDATSQLSTAMREGHLELYASELMYRMGLSNDYEVHRADDLVFFECELMTVYDRYSDDPKEYMGYNLVVAYRGEEQQGYIWFRCHADDKDTYRDAFFEIARSIEFL